MKRRKKTNGWTEKKIVVVLVLTIEGISVSEAAAPEAAPPPDGQKLVEGINQAIADSHFDPPIEVTDPIRAPLNSFSQWMVCIRSAQSEVSRRITYSAFFRDGVYTNSRYSALFENCPVQQYHLKL